MKRVGHRTGAPPFFSIPRLFVPVFPTFVPDGAARRATPARRRRELKGVVEAPGELLLELRPIAGDTQVASARDSTVTSVQQSLGERQRIADAQTKRLVQLSSKGEMNECSVRNPSGHAPLLTGDVRDWEV
jgi:hypothetical protein